MSVKLDTAISQTTATPEFNDLPHNEAPKNNNEDSLSKQLYKDFIEGKEVPDETKGLAPNKVSGFQGLADENTVYSQLTDKTTAVVRPKLTSDTNSLKPHNVNGNWNPIEDYTGSTPNTNEGWSHIDKILVSTPFVKSRL